MKDNFAMASTAIGSNDWDSSVITFTTSGRPTSVVRELFYRIIEQSPATALTLIDMLKQDIEEHAITVLKESK